MGKVVRMLPACVRIVPGARLDRVLQLGPQRLLPSSDRRNIVELWRVRIDREYLRVATERRLAEMARRRARRRPEPERPDNPCGQL